MDWIKQLKIYNNFAQIKEKLVFYEIPQKVAVVLFTYLFMNIKVYNQYYLSYLPLFAAIYFLSKDYRLVNFIAIIVSSLLLDYSVTLEVLMSLVIFYILIEGFTIINWTSLNKIPVAVTITILINSNLVLLLKGMNFTIDIIALNSYIAIGGGLLTYIFIKGITVLFYWNKKDIYLLDELAAFLVIINFMLFSLNMDIISTIGKSIIVIVSYYGGLLLGILNGGIFSFLMLLFGFTDIQSIPYYLVIAFVISLTNKQNKFFATITYLFIAVTVYFIIQDSLVLNDYFIESLIVAVIFFVIPKNFVRSLLVKVEGSIDYAKFQKTAYSDMRNRTSDRIIQLAHVFKSMSKTLSSDKKYLDEERSIEKIYTGICNDCYKRDVCWGAQKDETYVMVESILINGTQQNNRDTYDVIRLKNNCYQWNRILNLITKEREIKKIKKEYEQQLNTAKTLVGDQLNEVADVMTSFSTAIKEERDDLYFMRDSIIKNLQGYKYEVIYLNIETYKDYPLVIDLIISNVDREDLKNIIVPVISSFLKEPLHIKYRNFQYTKEGLLKARLVSKIEYGISLGVATKAKCSNGISGDNILKIKLPKDRYVIAVSDGMGSGERAYYESKETLRLLGQMLKSEIKTTNAVKTLNTIMSIRGQGEIFSTIDMSIFDFKKMELESIKVGAAPSFIVRDNEIIKINPNNLPVGIVKSIQVDEQIIQLKDNDLIVMVTDGAIDYVPNFEGMLRALRNEHPQSCAYELLENVTKNLKELQDDITIITIRVKKKA